MSNGLTQQQMQEVVTMLRECFEAHLQAEHSPEAVQERQAANKPSVIQVTHVCPDASCDGSRCIRADERRVVLNRLRDCLDALCHRFEAGETWVSLNDVLLTIDELERNT